MKSELIFVFLITVLLLKSCVSESAKNKKSIALSENDSIEMKEDKVEISFNLNEANPKDSVIELKHFYTDFSNSYDYSLIYYEKLKGKYVDSHFWTIMIFDKVGNLVDSIIQDVYVNRADFVDFKQSRSFITGKNTDLKVLDNYYGEFVVADFNFDSKDDFAIRNDLGGNGGAFYSFYINIGSGFELSNFLTDSLLYMPYEYDKNNKRLKSSYFSTVCGFVEEVLQYSQENASWDFISRKFVNVCDSTVTILE
jgi:hypothetical protein